MRDAAVFQSFIRAESERDIHDSGQHLLALINEILDLSRIEAGKYQLNEEPLSLAAVVEECCHMMELKARHKNLNIVTEFEPTLPRVFADERSVRQITLNLLSNAVKFSPAGGDILVRVGWTAGAGQYVSIKDNGPGISAEAARWLGEQRIAAFGVETMAPGVLKVSNRQVHHICGEMGFTHYENMINLHQLIGRGRFRFIGLPLKIRGGTGSPVRAVAVFEG